MLNFALYIDRYNITNNLNLIFLKMAIKIRRNFL